jgi:PAS domain S-box-containing protein
MSRDGMTSDINTVETRIKRCAVCKIDLKGRFVFVDEMTQDLLGYSMEELFARPLIEFLDEADHEVVGALIRQSNRYESFFRTFRVRMLCKEGEVKPVRMVASMSFAAGSPVNFQLVIDADEDSSDELPDTLSPEPARDIQEATDRLGIGLFLIDRNGRILWANPSAETEMGAVAVGLHTSDLLARWAITNDDALCRQVETCLEVLLRVETPDQVKLPELPIRLADGSPCRLLLTPVKAAGEERLCLMTVPSGGAEPDPREGLIEASPIRALLEDMNASNIAAGAFLNELLSNESADSQADAPLYMLGLGENLERTASAISLCEQLLTAADRRYAVQGVDIELLISRLHFDLTTMFPRTAINIKRSGPRKITGCPAALRLAVGGLLATFAVYAGEGRFDIDLTVQEETDGCNLQVTFAVAGASQCLKRVRAFFADSHLPDQDKGPAVSGHLHIVRYIVRRLFSAISFGRQDKSTIWFRFHMADRPKETVSDEHQESPQGVVA